MESITWLVRLLFYSRISFVEARSECLFGTLNLLELMHGSRDKILQVSINEVRGDL